MKISDIDKNFNIETTLQKNDIRFFDVTHEPVQVYGVFMENEKFRRLPEAVAASVNGGVYTLHTNTAGGRVRFRTDSSYVAIFAKMGAIGKMPHFALTGSAGFDLYENVDGEETYRGSFIPPFEIEDGFEAVVELETSKMRDITINFPLYSDVSALYIGLQEKAVLEATGGYIPQLPIVYYGSSITQGGCASRPGNSYQDIISRRFHCDYLNLGFSGSALAEDAIVEYMTKLPMSMFVLDYDHNAPTIAHLKNTHEKTYQAIRKYHPDIPIIMMSRPKHCLTEEEVQRLDIITATYRNAQAAGDCNIYLLSGYDLTRLCGNDGTVDNCHPNDLGFASMAAALGDLIEQIGCFKK